MSATRIGGPVGANPWLARGEARIIVNEVNSHAPSLLRGPLEIAGRSAELIVANPAGIQVQGASFLNAQRVTLAAATPLWNGSDLLGLRTGNGLLRIDSDPHGLGMDTRGASHTDILGRAVQVNAAVWANRLRVVTGQNTVAAGTETEPGAVTPADPAAGPPASPPPAFALDVSALGGLYANAITLVGTEAGLGVRHSGIIAARAEDGEGSLVITQNGQLLVRQGGRLIGQRMQIQADALVNEDGAAIAADRRIDIRVRRLTNRNGALIHSNADMALSATERLENRSATIEALGSLSITTGELLNANDLLTWRLQPNDPTNHLSYTANALRYKDALSDRLLAHAVATLICQEMARVGCASPYTCTDQATLQGYWAVAQQKAQALMAVSPESWLIDAKVALDPFTHISTNKSKALAHEPSGV